MKTKKDKKKDKTVAKNGAKGVRLLSLRLLFGDLVTSSVLNRNKFTILITVILLMFYITIKYECKTRMETISKLQNELDIVKSESVREQSEYMSRTRESVMTHLVDSMHLRLKIQEQPPYKLKYND